MVCRILLTNKRTYIVPPLRLNDREFDRRAPQPVIVTATSLDDTLEYALKAANIPECAYNAVEATPLSRC